MNNTVKLIKIASKLCEKAKQTYNSDGNNLTELLIAINEFELAKDIYNKEIEVELEKFNKYFSN